MDNTKFWDMKVPVFVNKRTGQMSVVLPKKKFKNVPKHIMVRVRK